MAQRQIGSGDLALGLDERVWLQAKWDKVRVSNIKADKADNKWNEINDAINEKLRLDGVIDVVAIAGIKNRSVPLRDALETGKWHAGNAQRHIDDAMLFLKLKEHGLL